MTNQINTKQRKIKKYPTRTEQTKNICPGGPKTTYTPQETATKGPSGTNQKNKTK
jgi:hypothetical protein